MGDVDPKRGERPIDAPDCGHATHYKLIRYGDQYEPDAIHCAMCAGLAQGTAEVVARG